MGMSRELQEDGPAIAMFENIGSRLDICAAHNRLIVGQVLLSMPSLGVSSLDSDRVVQTMRSFFKP
ncbi:hypothetical protein ASD44_10545 [Mesorhizobium sp. Root554]|nr:hypothetical protein ASD27_10555 [Mesorhizobium sp. Root1471]KQZ36968.1 hypothetical protein ASD44_10545 [Mesorhizobium sp. Root554]